MKEEVVKSQKNKTCKLFFESNKALEKVVKAQKIKGIIKNFVKKLRRFSTLYEPI
jgi:hypothetical protein